MIVVDDSKLVDRLGTRAPLPVEVIPFGWRTLAAPLASLGIDFTLREADGGKPFVTDGGHYILDCAFPDGIDDPEGVESRLRALPAVVETGLFVGMADTVVVAGAGGVEVRERGGARRAR